MVTAWNLPKADAEKNDAACASVQEAEVRGYSYGRRAQSGVPIAPPLIHHITLADNPVLSSGTVLEPTHLAWLGLTRRIK